MEPNTVEQETDGAATAASAPPLTGLQEDAEGPYIGTADGRKIRLTRCNDKPLPDGIEPWMILG